MTPAITTEWLESVGCSIEGWFAYDTTRVVCVAYKTATNGQWKRWKNYRGESPKFTARVKAPSVKETTP